MPAPIAALWALLRASWAARAVVLAVGVLAMLAVRFRQGRAEGRRVQQAESERHARGRVDEMHDRVDEAWDRAADDHRDVDERLREQGLIRDRD
jgi:membrane protein implicated in regulation of membrane protease activity